MLYQARHDSTSEISCIFHHAQNGSFRSHQILKVNCQRITHVGCCIKRKPRENIKVCVNVSRTSYRQVTDTLPTVGRQSTDCRPTDGQLSADRFFGELFFTITDRWRKSVDPDKGVQRVGFLTFWAQEAGWSTPEIKLMVRFIMRLLFF